MNLVNYVGPSIRGVVAKSYLKGRDWVDNQDSN